MQKKMWRVFVADSFTNQVFSGNQAGVVLLDSDQEYPAPQVMRNIAGELKHSETAFVKRLGFDTSSGTDVFHIRYFTPAGEVALCGHATIGAFQVLREEGIIKPGSYRLYTKAQELTVETEDNSIWMEMAAPKETGVITGEQTEELYRAYGLSLRDMPRNMIPKIVNTGLSDILLPVADSRRLQEAVQDEKAVVELSKRFDVTGVHMFTLGENTSITAYCRNFAPLYGIPEEAATGTANGALTYYLYDYGYVRVGETNTFLQGEAMGKASRIKSRLIKEEDSENISIWIGGNAVVSLKGVIMSNEETIQ